MNNLSLAQWNKVGFVTRVSGLKFVKENNIRKKKNQSIPQLLQEIKRERIAKKKTNDVFYRKNIYL